METRVHQNRSAENPHSDLPRTLIQEYAHALLHFDIDDDTERSKCEVEAEVVAYIVGRYCGFDTSESAFYLAAWGSDDLKFVHNRLVRITRMTNELIDVLEDCPACQNC